VVHSLLSVATFVFLIWAYREADTVVLWVLPGWAYWGLALCMLPAFWLLGGAVDRSNPIAGRKLSDEGPKGAIRVTRHPMLVGVAIWAVVHVLGNGDMAGFMFFGTLGVTALAGIPSIDRKLAARDPSGWAQLDGATSVVPFGAILAGRNRFVPAEIGRAVWIGGAVAWAAALALHPYIIGVSPLG
jgi:uncharacterized membrane protein